MKTAEDFYKYRHDQGDKLNIRRYIFDDNGRAKGEKICNFTVTLASIAADTVARQKMSKDVSHTSYSGCSNCWVRPTLTEAGKRNKKGGKVMVWGGYLNR